MGAFLLRAFAAVVLSTTAHKRSTQQWSYKQNFLLLHYSAHLSLDVHYSSQVKKKKKKKFLLTSLSSLIKIKISYSLSLSFSLSGFFFFLPQFFVLFSSPASSLVSLIPQLIGQLPHCRSVPPTQLSPLSLNDFDPSLRRPQRHRPNPPPASTSPALTSPTQVSSHLSLLPICDWVFFFF